jgi:neutral ceramidase
MSCADLGRAAARLATWLVLLALSACAWVQPPSPPGVGQPSAQAWPLLAGVATQDITPPPGLSLWGHGPEGRVSVGVLLRLRCTAFVLTSEAKGKSEAVALVPCDLAAVSLELQREVAQRVKDADVPLGAAQIFLMASHTHAGPAHYFGAQQFHDKGFSSREPGFDKNVLDFLAKRIAATIVEAYAKRQRAAISWQIGADDGAGLTRNRSYPAFAANADSKEGWPDEVVPTAAEAQRGGKRERKEACPTKEEAKREARSLTPAQRAVHQQISVLRVDHLDAAGGRTPAGIFAVFGIHNTAIDNTNDLYHGDIFGYAARWVEEQLAVEACEKKRARGAIECKTDWRSMFPRPPVAVGIANGIEGDVSPAVDFQAPREARRIGIALGERILALHAKGEKQGVEEPLKRIYRELWMPEAPLSKDRSLALHPALGAAAAGGAEDGPTRLRIFPAMNEGVRADREDRDKGKHGWKLPLVNVWSDFVGGKDFPAVAPIGLIQLGDHTLATAPFEMTTVAGLRIRDRLDASLGSKSTVMVGLTNSYLSYVSTKNEYDQQHYEGASTLYGPHTAEFLGDQFACLAELWKQAPLPPACAETQGMSVDQLYSAAYQPAQVSRLADDTGKLPEKVETNELKAWRVPRHNEWGVLVRVSGIPGSYVRLRERFTVEIRTVPENWLVDDDRGSAIELRLDDTDPDGQWSIRWVPGYRAGHPLCDRNVRMYIRSTVIAATHPFAVDCNAPHPRGEEGWLSPVAPPAGCR